MKSQGKPGSGRRPVLDEQKKREVLAILSVGCSRQVAARYVGCSPTTISNTAHREKDFARAVSRAETRNIVQQMKNITSAAEKAQYWRAAAWILERKLPEEFAERSPKGMDAGRMSSLLSEATEIFVEEIPEARRRQRVLKRLEKWLQKWVPEKE